MGPGTRRRIKEIKVKAYFFSDDFLNPFLGQIRDQGFKKTAQNTYKGSWAMD